MKYVISLFIHSDNGPWVANYNVNDWHITEQGVLMFVDEDGLQHWFKGNFEVTGK